MNVKILQRCIDEIGKPDAKLDYIRGMLETLVEVLDTEFGGKDITQVSKNIAKPVVNKSVDVVPDVPTVPLSAIEQARDLARESGVQL